MEFILSIIFLFLTISSTIIILKPFINRNDQDDK
jgi:hypothetical protein